jgi:WD40 repeat protein/tetratricopeptide (TPR) repeat protein
VAFLPDKYSALLNVNKQGLYLWDFSSGEEPRLITSEYVEANVLDVSPDESLALLTSRGDARIVEVSTGRQIWSRASDSSRLMDVIFSANGDAVIAGDGEGHLFVWDIESHKEIARLEHQNFVTDHIAASPDGRYIVTGGGKNWESTKNSPAYEDYIIRLWRLPESVSPPVDAEDNQITEVRRFEGHDHATKGIFFSPDGRELVTASHDRMLRVWAPSTGELLRGFELEFPTEGVVALPSGNQAVVFGQRLQLVDLETGTVVREFQGHDNNINRIAVSPDGRRLLSGSYDRSVRVWEIETGKELQRYEGAGTCWGVAFSPDGESALLVDQKAVIHWNPETGKTIRRLQEDSGPSIRCAAFSPDGSLAVAGGEAGLIRFWNLNTGEAAGELSGHTDVVHSLDFSADGRLLLSGSSDRTMRVWDLDSRREIARAQTNWHSTNRAVFSPDGRTAASTGGYYYNSREPFTEDPDCPIHIWQLPESVWPKESAALAAPGAFVVLGPEDAERKFDTLAEAVAASSPGDTIEIRGNGPFVTEPIELPHALTIRASDGFRPVLKGDPGKLPDHHNWIVSHYPLVLEGLAFDLVARKPAPASDDFSGQILSPRAALDAVNCRFHASGRCIFIASGADCRLRNCELLCSGGFGTVAVNIDETRAGQRVVVDNCVLFPVGIRTGLMRPGDADIQLLGNTFGSLEGGALTLDLRPNVRRGQLEGRVLRVQASANIYANDCVLLVGAPDEDILAPEETVRRLKTLLRWNGGANLFALDGAFVWMHMNGRGKLHPGKPVRDLADWKDFLGVEESDSLAGHVEYQGGDLLARLRQNPEQLTPDDFRQRPDSAGYRAGPDGKELGADIDLVGPGEAYQRWKKTQEYQQWRKETQSLMAEAAELDAALRLFDRQLRLGEWSAAAETFGVLLKQHDSADLAAPGSGYAVVRYAIVLVHLGELEQYHSLCAELLEQYGTTEDVRLANNVCRTCLILPGVVDASLLPVAPIDARLQTEMENGEPWNVEARALIAYRSGQYEEAINYAGTCIQRYANSKYLPRGFAILAMAQHKSGANEQARKTYDKAQEALQQASDGSPDSSVLYTEMLLREAAEVLGLSQEAEETSPALNPPATSEPESDDSRPSDKRSNQRPVDAHGNP